jgi:hypothetical protein
LNTILDCWSNLAIALSHTEHTNLGSAQFMIFGIVRHDEN